MELDLATCTSTECKAIVLSDSMVSQEKWLQELQLPIMHKCQTHPLLVKEDE